MCLASGLKAFPFVNAKQQATIFFLEDYLLVPGMCSNKCLLTDG